MEKNNYISPHGHKKLLEELDQLQRTERPEVTKLVQWAASNGDRSENADYIYGKRRLREIDRRIRFLLKRLDLAIVVDTKEKITDLVQFGATVELQDEEGLTKRFTVVGVDEIDLNQGRISWKSPIGQALLGKSVGDEVLVKVPVGELTYEIISVIYQPIE